MVQHSRIGLQQRLALAFTLVLLIPMAAVTAFSNITSRATLIDKVADAYQHLASERVRAVEHLLVRAASDVSLFAQAPILRSNAGALSADGAPLTDAFQRFLRRSPGHYAALCLLDAGGRKTLCVGDGAAPEAGGPPLDRALFEQALAVKGDAGAMVVAALTAAPGGRQIVYATPVMDDQGAASGVLTLTLPAAPIFDLLVDGDPQVSTAIIDGAGAYLVGPERAAA
jgi:hypothetical protein